MSRLVTEFHYSDGDVGAYDDLEVAQLWAQFTKAHSPSHVLIRPDTAEGQLLSNLLQRAVKMEAALTAFVNTVNATGGVVRPDTSFLAPAADEDWLDLGLAYVQACEALGRTPVVSPSIEIETGIDPEKVQKTIAQEFAAKQKKKGTKATPDKSRT